MTDTPTHAALAGGGVLARFERALADVTRLLNDRATVGDIASRSGYHLPPASWALLEYLDGHGPMPVSAVAACHGVDISSVTPRLKSLEAGGLIARHRDGNDARVHLIEIAAPGRAALAAVHAARRELLAAAIGDVDADALAGAAGVVERVAARLSTTHERIQAHTARRP